MVHGKLQQRCYNYKVALVLDGTFWRDTKEKKNQGAADKQVKDQTLIDHLFWTGCGPRL